MDDLIVDLYGYVRAILEEYLKDQSLVDFLKRQLMYKNDLTPQWSRRQQPSLVPRSGCRRGSPLAFGPSSTGVERRVGPG